MGRESGRAARAAAKPADNLKQALVAKVTPSLGATVPRLHRDWAHPSHVCTGTRLTPPTSAPGLGSPLPRLHRDWAHPSHICTGTGLTPLTSASGLGTPQVEHGAALVEHAILLAGMSPKRKCAEVDMDSDGGKAVPPPHACVRACLRARVRRASAPRMAASLYAFRSPPLPRSVACCAGGNEALRPPECRWYQCGGVN